MYFIFEGADIYTDEQCCDGNCVKDVGIGMREKCVGLGKGH